ncbi:MAG: TIGR03013 family XrtA/PEP-CTERM system glycosyltransferase [Candidatus Acidiferrum sp.]
MTEVFSAAFRHNLERFLIRLLHAYVPKRTLLLGISEACLITLALVASALARLGAGETRFMLTYQYGAVKILLVSVAFLLCMYYFDLYDSTIVSNRREAPVRLIQVLGVAYIALGLLYYLYPPMKLGRGIFHLGFLFVGLLLLLWRRLFSIINSTQGLAERVMILGEGALADSLLHEIERRPELGIRVAGHAPLPAVDKYLGNHEAPVVLAQTSSCEGLVMGRSVRGIDRIVVAMEERRGKLPVDLLLSLKNRGVQVQDGNDVYESITGKVPIESIRLSWLLFSPGSHASKLFLIYKRFASVMISIVGLLLSLPLIPFVILAIKLSSRGRVLYWQNRVGRHDRVFRCYKFRTMRSDAESNSGPIWAEDNDPRVTPVGRFLRKMRIDEIPQLLNVFKGDMSLVGPRPERPEFVAALNGQIPHYHLRHCVRPGITGWAQILYKYGSSIEDAKEKLRYDLFYIKNSSVGLDLLIVLKTIKIVLLSRGAK